MSNYVENPEKLNQPSVIEAAARRTSEVRQTVKDASYTVSAVLDRLYGPQAESGDGRDGLAPCRAGVLGNLSDELDALTEAADGLFTLVRRLEEL